MRRRIGLALAAVFAAILGIVIWQLDFPAWQGLDLNKIRDIPRSTVVFDGRGEKIGALYGGYERIFAPIEQIPEDVVSAFIIAEDQRFFEHNGIDVKRIFGALWHDIKTGSLDQGASTITQQLIKLTHLSSEKTLSRKVQEAVLALQLEKRMEKRDILEAYLNTVYFGRGAYGIGTAARVYFCKAVSDLTLDEGALLAGIIKSPSNYAPHLKPENALNRRNRILDAMQENGTISQEQHAEARSAKLEIVQDNSSETKYGWYMDQVLLECEDILGMDAEKILSAGLNIHTALNPKMQDAAEKLFENGANFPDPAPDGTSVQAAFIALDTESGGIAAIIGGREYAVRRGLNRAAQMLRQPGSAIKPVSTYAAALEYRDFLPTSFVEDVQREFPGKYMPGNAGGNYYGTVTLREALSRSLNVATVDLADLIGVQNVRSAITSFGLPLSAQDVNLSLSLGSMTHGVSPSRLCAAYCALANGGRRVQPHAVQRITNARGKVLYESKESPGQAVSPQTAFLLTDMLKTAAAEGSANALSAAGMPIMGKTGTVGEIGGGNRDIWTVAAVPEIAATVWMGFDEPDADHALPDWAGGGSYPARLCAAFFKGIRSELSGNDFAVPEGLAGVQIDTAALEEQHIVVRAAANTPPSCRRTEYFPEGRLPTEISTLWNAPDMIDDLALISGNGEAPCLAFTSRDANADYLLLRRSDDETEIAAVLNADAGQVIIWKDAQADMNAVHHYSVLPRHRRLYENGTVLTGPESQSVRWSPGGLLNRIFSGKG